MCEPQCISKEFHIDDKFELLRTATACTGLKIENEKLSNIYIDCQCGFTIGVF